MSLKTGKKVKSESTEDIQEVLKRKRDRDRIEQSIEKEKVKDIFKKCKKTVRSPENKMGGEEEAGDESGKERHKKEVAGIWLVELKKEIREELKGIREKKEEMFSMVEGVTREGVDEIRRKVEEIRKDIKIKERIWEKETEIMRVKIEKLEKELKDLKEVRVELGYIGKRIEKVEKREGIVKGSENLDMGDRMKRMEMMMEREERDKMKRNLVFKGVRKGKEDNKEEIRNICREIRVDIEIDEIRNIGTGREKKGEMIIVKIMTEENTK